MDGNPISISLRDPKYLAQLITLGLNQGFMTFVQNTWMATLVRVMNQPSLDSLTLTMLNSIMWKVTQSIPFFPQLAQDLFTKNLVFVKRTWGLHQPTQAQDPLSITNPLILEIREKRKDLERTERKQQEMESLLASMRVPKTNVLTLEKLVTLEFVELVNEMVVVLCLISLMKFEIGILFSRPSN